jgi:hypothetical protein
MEPLCLPPALDIDSRCSTRVAISSFRKSQAPRKPARTAGTGTRNEDLTLSHRRFVCPRCKICVDRDVAVARNNYLAVYGQAVGVGWDEESC